MEENRHNAKDIQMHYRLLRHAGCGVTELRTFKPVPQVAYTDNEDDFVRLCNEMDGMIAGVHVGVQPRPLHYLEMVENRWVPAVGGIDGNCAKDLDIEYISTCFWDIDVDTPTKNAGHPASDQELQKAIESARRIAELPEIKDSAVIGVSGNGVHVIVPIVPIAVYDEVIGLQFKAFCEGIVLQVTADIPSSVRIDPVYNLSRTMRVVGTVNKKGVPLPGRPHRRSCFPENPTINPSYELHQRICYMDVSARYPAQIDVGQCLRCNLKNLERCRFIQWCRAFPEQVSEPHWFGLISNLIRLEGGIERIHEISSFDKQRYDFDQTEQVIGRLLSRGYNPTSCKTLMRMQLCGRAQFTCPYLGRCEAESPMYMAINRIVF